MGDQIKGISWKTNGLKRYNVTNQDFISILKDLEPNGNWKKVYKDGWENGNKISVHYFQSNAGTIVAPKVKPGWSN